MPRIWSNHRTALCAIFAALLLTGLIAAIRTEFKVAVPDLIANGSHESAEFSQKLQKYVVENIGQPIDSGFTERLYLQAFSGLKETDFDGVETEEGRYVYADGKLIYVRSDTARWSTAEEAITEKGYQTLFATLKRRLGDLTVDEIISQIMGNDHKNLSVSVALSFLPYEN